MLMFLLGSRSSLCNYRKTHKTPKNQNAPTGQKTILYSDVVHPLTSTQNWLDCARLKTKPRRKKLAIDF